MNNITKATKSLGVDKKNVTKEANLKVAKKIKELRLNKGMTQAEVAKALDITKSTWAMYEIGARSIKDPIKKEIAAFFDTTVGELFFDEVR